MRDALMRRMVEQHSIEVSKREYFFRQQVGMYILRMRDVHDALRERAVDDDDEFQPQTQSGEWDDSMIVQPTGLNDNTFFPLDIDEEIGFYFRDDGDLVPDIPPG